MNERVLKHEKLNSRNLESVTWSQMARLCLVDADILAYECSFAGQFKDETGQVIMKDFDSVIEHLDLKLTEITEECDSNSAPILFLTGDEHMAKHINRSAKLFNDDHEDVVLRPSFRFNEAETKVYKGTRKSDKPMHYHNIRAYMYSNYCCIVSNGVEADDMMAFYQTLHLNDESCETIICSVDKDLRQVPGLHYSWSVGTRPSVPVYKVDELGTMDLVGKPKKLKATGLKSLYAQILMGDAVDNIQGIKSVGPVGAYNILKDCNSELELFVATARKYREDCGDEWEKKLREHVDLCYMIREFDDGNPVRYKYPKGWQESLDQEES